MLRWEHAIPVGIFSAIIAVAFLIVLRRCLRRKNPVPTRTQTIHNGIARLHQVSPLSHHRLDRESFRKPSPYRLFQPDKTPHFTWADHPSSVTDAVENGWSRFAFDTFVTSSSSSSSVKSALFGACAAADGKPSVETSWEVCQGSDDFVQKIRLNPISESNFNSKISVIRAALPLPGPNLGVNSSFPQEAYFEITIMPFLSDEGSIQLQEDPLEVDKVKLIGDFNSTSPGSLVAKTEDSKTRNDPISACVGLAGGGPLPARIPGTYQGSIAFNSTGSVYLDGTKLVFESKNHQWGNQNEVIGCGYNPSQKKVFFTVDAQLVHEIHCFSEGFSSPLFPTFASKDDITVMVNLGQSPFKYLPANLLRTPNPCFVRPLGASPALGYEEDSREFFSMGRIDSQWRGDRSQNNTVGSVKAIDFDQESDGDLFEIVLDDSKGKPQ